MNFPRFEQAKSVWDNLGTTTKIIGIIITFSGALVGYGEMRITVKTNSSDIEKHAQRLDKHDEKFHASELREARHEILDSLNLAAVKENTELIKQLRREGKIH